MRLQNMPLTVKIGFKLVAGDKNTIYGQVDKTLTCQCACLKTE
jgi:hypothetical protein